MTDTDSEMMRRQQNMDVPETIEPDETHPEHRADAATERLERERVHFGEAVPEGEGQDAVLSQNRRKGGAAAADLAAHAATGGQGGFGLARKGRSLLGG